jgi:hypothetical protein
LAQVASAVSKPLLLMSRQRKADNFSVLHLLIMTEFGGFVSEAFFFASCKDYLWLMFAVFPTLGEETIW